MPNPRAAELRDLTDDDLVGRLAETKQELFNLRFQLATGQQENNARVSQVRRQVARIETELRAREIAAAEALAQEGTR